MKRVNQRQAKRSLKGVVTMLALSMFTVLATTADAQSDRDRYSGDRTDRYEERRDDERRYSDRRYDDNSYDSDRGSERRRPSYDYCRDRARDITGYRGRTPNRHRGGALEGAIKGGLSAGAGSWIGGGDKEQIKKAQKRGAKLGFIIGAIKAGQGRERDRENDRRRRDYEFEVNACMNDY